MDRLDVIFRSWKEPVEMPAGYAVSRNANDYIQPLNDLLYQTYVDLRAYMAEGPEAYAAEIAELRGKCLGLAWAIGSFHRPEDPEAGLAEARLAIHGRWTEEYGEEV
jgi:hypothetical protein